MNIVLKRGEKNNIFTLIVCLMFLSGIISTVVVLLDASRPICYELLWMLPITFSISCSLVYAFRKFLFTRISITMIVGLYWVRMVVTPVLMVLGDYAVFPENTSWQAYLPEAIMLECYEACVMFPLLLLWSKHLACENRNVFMQGNTKKLHHPRAFTLLFGLVCLFFFGMILRWPVLIRYQFIPIWGAPQGWAIPALEQRSLNGTGSGPLGIFVTIFVYLILVMQILLPALILTWILNHGRPGTSKKKVLCALLLIGLVLVIATESRLNSVFTALALLLTLMSHSNKKQLRLEACILVILVLFAMLALWIKQGNNASTTNTVFLSLSQIFTAYFSGPQNTAAAIQATKESLGPDPFRIWPDIVQNVPYVAAIWRHLTGTSVSPGCSLLFNQTLYGMTERSIWEQLLSPIGEGYMHGGFLLAPLIPAVTGRLSIWLEETARKAIYPISKNLGYVGAAFMAYVQVNLGLAQTVGFLWYIGLTALIALPILLKRSSIYERNSLGAAIS